jgi:hypothetical protein
MKKQKCGMRLDLKLYIIISTKLTYLGKLSTRKVDEMSSSIFVIFRCVFVDRTLCGDGL